MAIDSIKRCFTRNRKLFIFTRTRTSGISRDLVPRPSPWLSCCRVCFHLIPPFCNHTPQLTTSAPDLPASSALVFLATPRNYLPSENERRGPQRVRQPSLPNTQVLVAQRPAILIRCISIAVHAEELPGPRRRRHRPLAHVLQREIEKVTGCTASRQQGRSPRHRYDVIVPDFKCSLRH